MAYNYKAKISVQVTSNEKLVGKEQLTNLIKEILEEEYGNADMVISVMSVDDFDEWEE